MRWCFSGIHIAFYVATQYDFMEVVMKKVFVMVLAGLFLMLGVTAFAMGPGDRGERRDGHFMRCSDGMDMEGGMWANLNLSKEQAEKMWQLKEKFHTDTQAIRFELFQKRMELKTLYADPKATDAAIIAKQKEVDVVKQKFRDKMVLFKLDQRKVLTPEQLKKLGESKGPHGPGAMGHGPHGKGPAADMKDGM